MCMVLCAFQASAPPIAAIESARMASGDRRPGVAGAAAVAVAGGGEEAHPSRAALATTPADSAGHFLNREVIVRAMLERPPGPRQGPGRVRTSGRRASPARGDRVERR